jgi:hypothetical protein
LQEAAGVSSTRWKIPALVAQSRINYIVAVEKTKRSKKQKKGSPKEKQDQGEEEEEEMEIKLPSTSPLASHVLRPLSLAIKLVRASLISDEEKAMLLLAASEQLWVGSRVEEAASREDRLKIKALEDEKRDITKAVGGIVAAVFLDGNEAETVQNVCWDDWKVKAIIVFVLFFIFIFILFFLSRFPLICSPIVSLL